ncbi:rhomboid family intramembrane serine protease [Xanthomonadaceae bacterium XH05]|nr:rhomboid family intramembrane serine protease [Xanthomonadaceae bacterium XH05]
MDVPLNQPLSDPREQARLDRRRFTRALFASAGFIALLWWIKMFETGLDVSFSALGVTPGSLSGLIGLLTAPLLHASVGHLINNTLPLLVLGTLALAIYPRASRFAVPLIWLGSGLGIWLIGRDSVHLGASGLSHGLMLFLFSLGLLRRDRPAIAAAMIAFFLYGGMVLTVLPGDPQVSWEAHMSGAACGVLAALLWFRRDPPPARKRYSWEDEDESVQPLEDALAAQERDMYEPAAPRDVPVLWVRPESPSQDTGTVVPFPPRPRPRPGSEE